MDAREPLPGGPSRPVSRIATAAVLIAAGALALPVIGVLGIHLGLLAPMTGFTLFAAGAVLGGTLALVLGLIALVATRGGKDPDGRLRAFTAVGGGLALLGVVALAGSPGAGLPPINDITTDLADPPAFAGDPSGRGREMGYPPDFVAQVRAAYPDLAPLHIDGPPQRAFALAEQAADALGWTITQRDPARGVLQAEDRTVVFRFVDDVVVRVRPDGGGSRIDVRSKSRDGRGDVGANAARIRAFLAELRARAPRGAG